MQILRTFFGLYLFQFLIGKLETTGWNERNSRKQWFQFLIGKLETDTTEVLKYLASLKFQFLIGKLET